MESAPPLKGYVRFAAKPAADTLLSIGDEKKDPLYVRWQYGLGRAAVFTSDAKSRWASQWVTWPGFDKFWINVTRDLLPHSAASEASAQFDAANQDLVVEYHLGPGVTVPAGSVPDIFVSGAGRLRAAPSKSSVLRRAYTADDCTWASCEVCSAFGPSGDPGVSRSGHLSPTGRDARLRLQPGLLKQISSLTGGQFEPAAADVFRSGGRTCPLLAALAGVAGFGCRSYLAELVVRNGAESFSVQRRGEPLSRSEKSAGKGQPCHSADHVAF